MFKIKSISLLDKNCKVVKEIKVDKPINYIYAPNSKGKTLLINSIDYVLGSSTIDFRNHPDFEGIGFILCECFNSLLIARDIQDPNHCLIKESMSNYYQDLSLDNYKSAILNIVLEGNGSDLYVVNRFYGEDLTYRPFLFFNFLDQKKHGLLKFIFTKLFDSQYYYYSKPIFKYLFNKDNIQKIYKNIEDIERLKKEKENMESFNQIYSYYKMELFKYLQSLGIKTNDNLNEVKVELINLRLTNQKMAENNNLINKDYLYLLDIRAGLLSEITKMEQDQMQASLTMRDIEKKEKMLSSLEDIIKDDNSLGHLIAPLEELIQKNKLYYSFIKVQDYKSAIKNSKNKLIQIERELNQYKANTSENNYLEIEKNISCALEFLSKLKDLKYSETSQLDNDIKKLSKENKKLENLYDESLESEISNVATQLYKTLKDKNIEFVDKDFEKDNFELSFDYRHLTIRGTYTESDKRIYYDVGSHARQTIIQVCCYLSFLAFLSKHEYSLPIIKTVMFDCVSQPLDRATRNEIKTVFDYFVNNINNSYNFIITSDNKESCDSNFYDMSQGLNPLI